MDHQATCDELRHSPAYLLVNALVSLIVALLPRGNRQLPGAQTA